MTRKQELVKDVFTGCAQVREEEDSDIESMGKCIDRSIISEEENKFRLTSFGRNMTKKGRRAEYEIDIEEGPDVIIER